MEMASTLSKVHDFHDEHKVMMPTQQSKRKKALRLIRLLQRIYPTPNFERGDPLEQVVRTVLSQKTTSSLCRKAFLRLREDYPTWKEVHNASLESIAESIRSAGLANQKARKIKGILESVHSESNGFQLDYLQNWDDDAVLKFLLKLPGVGQKTAKCVMIFSLQRDCLPVDTHVERVSRRLGLLHGRATSKSALQELESAIPEGHRAAMHVYLFEHGRAICQSRHPKCHLCVLKAECAHFQESTKLP